MSLCISHAILATMALIFGRFLPDASAEATVPVLPPFNNASIIPPLEVGRTRSARNDADVVPLPPNTGMVLVADVAGSTLANDAYWAEKCKAIPTSTLFLVLDMGAVRDFFKPADAGTSYCEMLQAHNKHQWSPNGVDWFAVEFISYSDLNGGSFNWWPRDKGVEGDAREFLSFWGVEGGTRTGGCCSTSTAVERTLPTSNVHGWGQSFTMSYALPLHPLPPNMGMSLVANVPGSTVANNAFWSDQCKTIPASTLFLVLDMGTVRDFFKPTEGSTYCEMLQARNKHQWSPNGVDWLIAVEFHIHNGGSAVWWPRDKGVEGDARTYLSFWGNDSGNTGGCCSTSTAVARTDGGSWAVPFTLSYALPLHPLPQNIGMSLVANVPGTTVTNDAYWANKCKTIPSNTAFLVLDMGAVRDFFKPTDDNTYCDMLQAPNKHQWSPNGVDWLAIDFETHDSFNGGSAFDWPLNKGKDNDKRNRLSIWGDDGTYKLTGGCCSSSIAVDATRPSLPGNGASTYWGQSFTVSLAIFLQPSGYTQTGRYLRIDNLVEAWGKKIIDLKEIEVFGPDGAIALEASSANMSSVYKSSKTKDIAAKCIDGDRSTTCHSAGSSDPPDPNPWIFVDYGEPVEMSKIVITNRPDAAGQRAAGATVSITQDAAGEDVVWSGTLSSVNFFVYTIIFEPRSTTTTATTSTSLTSTTTTVSSTTTSITSTTTTTVSTTTVTETTQTDGEQASAADGADDDNNLAVGVIVGGAVGAIAVIGVIIIAVVYLKRSDGLAATVTATSSNFVANTNALHTASSGGHGNGVTNGAYAYPDPSVQTPSFVGVTLSNFDSGGGGSVEETNLDEDNTDDSGDYNTCDPDTDPASRALYDDLVFGAQKVMAKGLESYLGKKLREVGNEMAAIKQEFQKRGTAEDKENLKHVLAGTMKFRRGGERCEPEWQSGNITLEALLETEEAKKAGLQIHHVLALRLYSTSSYKRINDPLRQSVRAALRTGGAPHPFAATTLIINEGIKLLQASDGDEEGYVYDFSDANEITGGTQKVFWRGIKWGKLPEIFLSEGGTEYACMSTSKSMAEAAKFSEENALLLKFECSVMTEMGAGIAFLSTYPKEQEFLYPPLTYLRPNGRRESIVVDGRRFTVYPVRPVVPTL